jgi:hypothetical protein
MGCKTRIRYDMTPKNWFIHLFVRGGCETLPYSKQSTQTHLSLDRTNSARNDETWQSKIETPCSSFRTQQSNKQCSHFGCDVMSGCVQSPFFVLTLLIPPERERIATKAMTTRTVRSVEVFCIFIACLWLKVLGVYRGVWIQ